MTWRLRRRRWYCADACADAAPAYVMNAVTLMLRLVVLMLQDAGGDDDDCDAGDDDDDCDAGDDDESEFF